MLAIVLSTILFFWSPLRAAVSFSRQDDRYLPILVAPFLCVYLLHWRRREIFEHARLSLRIGVPLSSLALLLLAAAVHRNSSQDPVAGFLPVALSMVFLWMTGFLLCYGISSFRMAIYPLACLLLTIPLPSAWLDRISVAFQAGSATASYAILTLFGVPVLREGTTFSIPGLTFNVAPECSGIRSGLAFLMVGILASRLFLRSPGNRLLLILSTVPITIVKNAVRIVVTTTLAAYVDRSYIDGPFHHQYGGIIFSPLDFVLFLPLLWALQKRERRSPQRSSSLETLHSAGASPTPEITSP